MGWRGFRFREKPDDENFPDAEEGESGLFRSNENILLKTFKSFLNTVLFRAAMTITMFWFCMYGLILVLQKLVGLLPKISLQIGKKDAEQSDL